MNFLKSLRSARIVECLFPWFSVYPTKTDLWCSISSFTWIRGQFTNFIILLDFCFMCGNRFNHGRKLLDVIHEHRTRNSFQKIFSLLSLTVWILRRWPMLSHSSRIITQPRLVVKICRLKGGIYVNRHSPLVVPLFGRKDTFLRTVYKYSVSLSRLFIRDLVIHGKKFKFWCLQFETRAGSYSLPLN